jgi:nonsense-mediated mRNA decay protein 3
MPQRFCAICGKEIDKSAPHFGMCLKCYLNEHPLFEIPKEFSFKICPDCGSYSPKEEWFKSEKNDLFHIIENATFKILLKPYTKEDKIDFSLTFDKNSFIFTSKDLLKSMIFTIEGRVKEDINLKHNQNVNLNLNYELCKNCVNLRGGTYFLSIIQLRVKDENYFEMLNETLNTIQKYVEKLFDKDHRQYISKIEDQKFGVDLYLSTNELMNYIIKFLKLNYHFILKRSKKLVGRDTQKGRNLYRLKSLIKFLPVEKNDVILVEDGKYIVESFISKNKVILRSEQGTKLIKTYAYFFNENLIINKD